MAENKCPNCEELQGELDNYESYAAWLIKELRKLDPDNKALPPVGSRTVTYFLPAIQSET